MICLANGLITNLVMAAMVLVSSSLAIGIANKLTSKVGWRLPWLIVLPTAGAGAGGAGGGQLVTVHVFSNLRLGLFILLGRTLVAERLRLPRASPGPGGPDTQSTSEKQRFLPPSEQPASCRTASDRPSSGHSRH